MRKWNDPVNESAYNDELNKAYEMGFTEEELRPRNQNLDNPGLGTGSQYFRDKIVLAYTLGVLKGIRTTDKYKDGIGEEDNNGVITLPARWMWGVRIDYEDGESYMYEDDNYCTCSVCKTSFNRYDNCIEAFDFCPVCGARIMN